MSELKEYQKVRLKDGREGYIIEICLKTDEYMIELPKFEIITVHKKDIEKVIK